VSVARRKYLGDGAYVERTAYGDVMLSTSDGIRTTNNIFLDDDVLRSFLDYLSEQQIITWAPIRNLVACGVCGKVHVDDGGCAL